LSREFDVVDLFGAPGGLALGFKMCGHFRILACVDCDPAAAATYAGNFTEARVIVDKIQNIDASHLLREAETGREKIDVVIGGPPCPGFSTVGRVKIASLARAGKWNHLKNSHPRFIDDPRNILYKHFVRVVKALRPKFFVMENVFGMTSYNNGETVKQVLDDFGRIGYRTEWKVLNAVNYGVPQERKRIFFIGNRLGVPNQFPAPSHISQTENSEKNLKKAPTVWDAIGDLPRLRAGEGEERQYYNRKPFTHYQKWARRGSKFLFNHVAREHSERDMKLFRYMREGMRWSELPISLKKMYGYRDDVFKDKMKRLYRNRPAWTITAHLAKDGYAYIHPTQDRTITVREAARLQSFPDTFIFHGSRTNQFRQVGNAVPPLLAMAVAREIRKALESCLHDF
jgi:DNA (cytosine-5)-methyltransferase 1